MREMFRKKFALSILLWGAGTALAFIRDGTDLGEYTMFATLLLGVFGTQDVLDKKLANKNPDDAA
jgi:hypothetical protein